MRREAFENPISLANHSGIARCGDFSRLGIVKHKEPACIGDKA
jgi:hypothetical protein